MRILFTGGGTMGSVTPLIAIAEQLKIKDPNIDLFWIGTKSGPEKKVIENYNISFKSIPSGKWRRYFSLYNLIDIFKILTGFFYSIILIKKIKPSKIISAGGFVAVPVVWAGWLCGVESLVHQQDVIPGLANKLCAKAASKITVCFPETKKYFNKNKTKVIGNPVREALKHPPKNLHEQFNLKSHLPVVLITTGGRGAMAINDLVADSLTELTRICQIIHITGHHRSQDFIQSKRAYDNYHEYKFMIDTTPALAVADLIISRAGMGTLTEIAYLSKPSIIIPIPNSHQQSNANYFQQKNAVELLDQQDLDADMFIEKIKELLNNKKKIEQLSENIHHIISWTAEEKICESII